MDFCVERLRLGEWVHIFPEGRVNVEKEHIRFKWGVGRLVAESAAGGPEPLVLPVWHEGLDRLMPNVEPYRFSLFNSIHVAVGEPIRLLPLLDRLVALPHIFIVSNSHCLTLSLSHILTATYCHCLTFSLPQTLTASHSHCLTLSLPHTLTASHSYYHTLSLPHSHSS